MGGDRQDYTHEVRPHDSRALRAVFATAGLACVALGIAGVVLPVLPATPFFLVAAACFARASPRFYNALLNDPTVGPTVLEWRRHRSIAFRTKLWAIVLMSATLAASIVFFIEDRVLQALLAVLGLLLAVWLWRVPSRDRPGAARTAGARADDAPS